MLASHLWKVFTSLASGILKLCELAFYWQITSKGAWDEVRLNSREVGVLGVRHNRQAPKPALCHCPVLLNANSVQRESEPCRIRHVKHFWEHNVHTVKISFLSHKNLSFSVRTREFVDHFRSWLSVRVFLLCLVWPLVSSQWDSNGSVYVLLCLWSTAKKIPSLDQGQTSC